MFEVIAYRLPGSEACDYNCLMPYQPEDSPDWTADEALFALLVARVSHPELRRKNAALAGCVELMATAPSSCIAGLRQAFRYDTPASSLLLILQAILFAETAPYLVSEALSPELEQLLESRHFGLHWTSAALLIRLRGEINCPVEGQPADDLDFPRDGRVLDGRVLAGLDWGDRIAQVEGLWPGFTTRLSARFSRSWWATEANQERAVNRIRAARSPSQRRLPETPLLLWDREMFECALHEQTDAISAHLLNSGHSRPETELDLLQRLLPGMLLHLDLWHSRDIRPPTSRPSMLQDGAATVAALEDVGEFNGWVRCGYYEEELLPDEKTQRDVSERVTVIGGIQLGSEALQEHVLPVGMGRSETWVAHIHHSGGSESADLPLFSGPLVGLQMIEDLLGYHPILALHPRVVEECELQPGPWPGRLELRDENGSPAAVLRVWSVSALGDGVGEETPRLRGCDLVLRPDIYGRILRINPQDPWEVWRVLRYPVPLSPG